MLKENANYRRAVRLSSQYPHGELMVPVRRQRMNWLSWFGFGRVALTAYRCNPMRLWERTVLAAVVVCHSHVSVRRSDDHVQLRRRFYRYMARWILIPWSRTFNVHHESWRERKARKGEESKDIDRRIRIAVLWLLKWDRDQQYVATDMKMIVRFPDGHKGGATIRIGELRHDVIS